MDGLALIDFEASCLPEYGYSFPIEVALARTDGTSHTWIIRPAPAWEFWDWSQEAEKLHGLSRERIEKEGLPVTQVLSELTEAVGTCAVFADADLDAFWLEVLAEAAGRPVPFSIRYLGEYMDAQGYTRDQVLAALEEARTRMPREHVARDDASRLALVVRLLDESRGEGMAAP